MRKRLFAILLLALMLLSMLPASALAEEPGEGEPTPEEPPVVDEPPAEPEPPQETETPQPIEPPAEPETPQQPEEPAAEQTPVAGRTQGTAADAEENEGTEEAEEAEATGNAWGIPADDVIWFGFYDERPIDWLVLDPGQTNMGTEGVFLLSRDLIDYKKVMFDEESTVWEGSLGQQWCTNFAASAFSPSESGLVPLTSKHDEQVRIYLLVWGEMDLKEEQVFFLSAAEMEQFFGSTSKEIATTVKPCSMKDYYWLRSVGIYHYGYHGAVLFQNTVHDYFPYHHFSARPCMNLSLQDALWVLPAEDEGLNGPARRPEGPGEEPQEWKLLIPGEGNSFRVEQTAAKDGVLSLHYAGADTGENNRISLLARDETGAPLALWRLSRPESAEGELELDLAAMELPENARLFLFCEELGDEQRTNYASALQELKPSAVVEEPSPSPEPEEENTGIIEPVAAEKPLHAVNTGRTLGRVGKIIAAALLGLLAVGLILAAVRRQSIIPLVLLILLLLLAAIVDLRAGTGFFPGL